MQKGSMKICFYKRTCTSHAGIIGMCTVVDANGVGSAVFQSLLNSSTVDIVQ